MIILIQVCSELFEIACYQTRSIVLISVIWLQCSFIELNTFSLRSLCFSFGSGAEMTELADKLNYDREVIRVWFCNKRQALKNTIKRLKAAEGGLPS